MPSLLLGTAQWGLDYGITNSTGRIPDSELVGIVSLAIESGLRVLDTAPAYGDAEVRLREFGESFEIQTKVSGAELDHLSIVDQLRESNERLGRETVARVLVHDWSALSPEHRAVARSGLLAAKAQGLVGEIGASLYETKELIELPIEFPEAMVVQAPASLLDQRIVREWRAVEGRFSGVSFQARSVFLQGAALSAPEQVPFGNHPAIEKVREAASELGRTPLQLCIDYVKSQPEIDEVVLGVTSEAELCELLDAWRQEPVEHDWSALESADVKLIDPRTWTHSI